MKTQSAIYILKKEVSARAKNYRSYCNKMKRTEDSEERELNEFISGKTEAYEECLRWIKESISKSTQN
mgnify:CR=1 FL=1|jgi:hypothetical protein